MNPARIAVALILFCTGTVFAKGPFPFHYLAADSISLPTVLSGPPAKDSAENRADIEAVLARQKARTAGEIARARSEEGLSPAVFASVFGSWFNAGRLPVTFGLLNAATDDARAIAASAKQFWQRPRPPLQDAAIHPIVEVPASASYPSFHSTRGALWAAILAQVAPDLKPRILARGAQIGEDRVIAGVHFPTDVAAGQKLGRVLAERFLANPAFQHDLKAAQAEFLSARPKSAAVFSVKEFALAAMSR